MNSRQSSPFQRARRPAQIEERRERILSAAKKLLKERGLAEVSLADIAAKAQTVKSNLYRYFSSREHIYLLILQGLGAEWEELACHALRRIGQKASVKQVAKALTKSFAKSGDYAQLISVFYPTLERSLTPELAVNFRMVFLERRKRLAKALSSALPGMSERTALSLTLPIFAHVAGIWPLCHIPEEAHAHLAFSEPGPLEVDFEKEMAQFLETLFIGARARGRRARNG